MDIQVSASTGMEPIGSDRPGMPHIKAEAALGISPRYLFSGKLRILDKSTRRLCGIGWGADLSCTGIGFFSAVELDLRDFIVVEFERNGTMMQIEACITRHSGTRYGAEFLHVPAATRRIIETSFADAVLDE